MHLYDMHTYDISEQPSPSLADSSIYVMTEQSLSMHLSDQDSNVHDMSKHDSNPAYI